MVRQRPFRPGRIDRRGNEPPGGLHHAAGHSMRVYGNSASGIRLTCRHCRRTRSRSTGATGHIAGFRRHERAQEVKAYRGCQEYLEKYFHNLTYTRRLHGCQDKIHGGIRDISEYPGIPEPSNADKRVIHAAGRPAAALGLVHERLKAGYRARLLVSVIRHGDIRKPFVILREFL